MSWLKSFGDKVSKGIKILSPIIPVFGPVIDAMIPGDQSKIVVKASTSIEEMSSIIATMEAIGVTLKLQGPQKYEAAVPLMTQLILKSDLLTVHKVKDQAKFDAAVKGFTQATHDLLESFDEATLV